MHEAPATQQAGPARERTKQEILTPDLCIIGGGSGGLSAAAIAASFGVPVVLFEEGAMGGDCLNVGCVPSKALIAAGERAAAMAEAPAFGIAGVEPQVDFAALRDHIADVIAGIAPHDSVERFTALGVRVITARARFEDARTVVGGGIAVRARRFVIATGSRPAIPPIPGLDSVNYLTNETIFRLSTPPEHLLVLGGGPIGLEIAQSYRRLGIPVTVVEAARVLAREDAELAGEVARALREEGVVLREGASVVSAASDGGRIVLRVKTVDGEEDIAGSHLLVATGRAAASGDLGLDQAGITADKHGIVVDAGLRTSNRRVYAIGDCASGAVLGQRFTHAANYHAGLVIRSALFGAGAKARAELLPRVTYTDPELAVVGLSEEEAQSRHRDIRILRWPFAETDRGRAERRVRGHVKAIVAKNGRVLGCAIAGPGAGELITPWTLAIAKGLKAADIAGLVIPYPTYSEASKRAAVELLRPLAQNKWVRRYIGLVRRFG